MEVSIIENSGGSFPDKSGLNNTSNWLISYILTAGSYAVNLGEDLKDKISVKINYQEQLNKLLKLNIVTYSFGKRDVDDI